MKKQTRYIHGKTIRRTWNAISRICSFLAAVGVHPESDCAAYQLAHCVHHTAGAEHDIQGRHLNQHIHNPHSRNRGNDRPCAHPPLAPSECGVPYGIKR